MPIHKSPDTATREALEANRREYAIHQTNLRALEERKARHGMDAGVALNNEVDHERSEIQRLDHEYSELLSRQGAVVPQLLQPLPTALGKYDSFIDKLATELEELNNGGKITPGRLEALVTAALHATSIAEHVFATRYMDGKWSVQAEAKSATVALTALVERSPALRDLLARAAQLDHAATVTFADEGRRCVFIPSPTNTQQVLVLYGLSHSFEPDNALDIILSTLLVVTKGLTQPHPSTYIESAIYNALRQQLGYVSLPMYERQFGLFTQRLAQMTVFFEPIIFLSPDAPRISAWEALARDANTALAPTDLFQTAELWGTRFKLELDMYFLRKATDIYPIDPEQLLVRKHALLPLSVNVYPESLIRTRYFETLKQIGAAGHMPLDSLFLEISEKSNVPAIEDAPRTQHSVEAFRERLFRYMDLGVRFSIDDFGVGYASSSRLSRLGPACVKIDRDALSDAYGHFTLAYVLGLARRMPGYTQVIVEGFDSESAYSLRRLYELGVRYIQGHTYGPARSNIDNRLPKGHVETICKALHGL